MAETRVDASRYKSAARLGRDAAAAGDTSEAVARFEEALALWRGIPELPDGRRGTSEKTRWIEGHAALVEDRADALLATGRAAEIIGELEAAVAEAPLRERRWGQLMLALYRAGRQGEALGAYQRARALLVEELGVDPGPELRRLEAAIVAQDGALEVPAAQQIATITRAVTFLLTDIKGSTAAWEADAGAMAVALARHDELVEQVVTSRGGRLIKTRGEGDATFSVFERPSAAAAAAIELQDAIVHEPWVLREPMRVRVALHTGEAELRDGDYFGRAVNRAARLRSLAAGGQILCSGATAELVIDSLSDDVVLADLGMRELRNLARPEHVFELRLETADDRDEPAPTDAPLKRPALPAVLIGPGPFVGRRPELERLFSAWQTALAGGTNAVLIAGEPGVGKTRLAGEWSRLVYEQGALVIYGRCDEDLGAPYQPFAEALRYLVPCLGASRLRGLRGFEALLPLVPGLTDVLPDLAAPTRADPDTERYALFDAVVALLGVASSYAPVALILDDLHWAAKPTLLLLRHLLRFGEQARVQIIGTYRSTDLDRSHPLSAMLADLHRDGTANRLQLSGLDEDDVTAYVTEAGYDDEELARALASVTGGNPFFLIEALRHVDESGGRWDQSTLPQGVREAVSRRLSRLAPQTNKALAAAAVVGSRFALELVERVVGDDLVDAFDEAGKAGIVIEEPGGRYRFNHALVRQSLLAELPSVRRMRLHQRIATTLENEPGADDELLAELAYHYFECAWAGNAAKAVEYCRRAADQAMARLAYEGAADLYDHALHALEEIDDELPDRDDQVAELLIARCEALLAAGDVTSAAGAVSELLAATVDSARLAAWATCFDGQLSMLIHPERLDEAEAALRAAADKLAELDDAAGEAKAHTVRAGCLARLGRIGDCEAALDNALTAARRAREHRRVNAVLAGAPLAALWGPNPVPRAGGRCLDVVRLLRITTDSPAVEATSTRCQAVLEAFRGRAEAARRMIESARRTVTELGLRHALMEVEQFAGIVELVVDDPAAAEAYLRKAYNGFRRMGLDADTAETAALLGRACLAIGRDAEADELCTESECLAGNALKASIAWRTLRARLLSRQGDHAEARLVAEAAVSLAERTDALVDHADACVTLATVLGAAGDAAGARAAAQRAVALYERKGAAALAERARSVLGQPVAPPAAAQPEAPAVVPDNAAVRVGERVMAAVHRRAWDEFEQLFATDVSIESRRKVVGLTLLSDAVRRGLRRELETGNIRIDHVMVAARGDRLALSRLITTSLDGSPGPPRDELLQLYAINEEGRVATQVWFDVEDLDAALAELDALHARIEGQQPKTRRLENAASRIIKRLLACFAARDWADFAEILADDILTEDRRRVVNAGIRQDRDAEINDFRSAADLGVTNATSDVIATRGERLVLIRSRLSRSDEQEAFHVDLFWLVETGGDDRAVSWITFDIDDFDAAIAEVDARYAAGEAAAHARAWSVVTGAFVAHNRREIAATTPDAVSVDHRRVARFALGEGIEYLRAGWDLYQTVIPYIETVHRLSDRGAVFTWEGYGTSHEGLAVEWRGVNLFIVQDEMVSRTEVFDEEDVDAALARFDELSRSARGLENEASRVYERLRTRFAARDFKAIAEMVANDASSDDRRRTVNSGRRQGRDAVLTEIAGIVDIGVESATSNAIAIRGDRLVLSRVQTWGRDQRPEAFHTDALDVVEIDADGRFLARVVFDADNFDAAVEELDARYLAGEAAAHAHTWAAITAAYDAINRHELPSMTPGWVNVDHRQGRAFAPGEMIPYVHATWDIAPQSRIYIETVHRLSDRGAVVTNAMSGSSREGFDAEWREVFLLTFNGDDIDRAELFDEADLDAAVAGFEQLSRLTPRLQNTAAVVFEHVWSHFAARNWDAVAETVAENYSGTDRRRVVNAGIQHDRDAVIDDLQAAADVGFTISMLGAMAVRGERLVLARVRAAGRDPEAIQNDALNVVEIDAEKRIATLFVFDLEDFDAAIAELDARYLAGEAAAHAHTWSLVVGAFAAINRHELPELAPDWVNVDHRRGAAFATGEMTAYLHDLFKSAPDINVHVEVVHRLSNLGAVVTQVAHGTSQQGFQAEWREIGICTFDGDRLSRCELFDEADLAAAIARFEELSRAAPRLENAASQAGERFLAHFAASDWDAMAEMLADNFSNEDRRRMVGVGVRHGRGAQITDMRVIADLFSTKVTPTTIAIRGARLALIHLRFAGRDHGPEEFFLDTVGVLDINADEKIVAAIFFEVDDIDAAIAELDARYLAGEAAPYASVYQRALDIVRELNRHEAGPMIKRLAYTDHRRVPFADGDYGRAVQKLWLLVPDARYRVQAVHALDAHGVVASLVIEGTDAQGNELQWARNFLLEPDEPRLDIYEDSDLDAALARFEESRPKPPRLQNGASQVTERFLAHYAAHDWDAMAQVLADNFVSDDRRRLVGAGVRHGRDAQIADNRAIARLGKMNMTSTVIATRGDRLVLLRTRLRFADRDSDLEAFVTEVLGLVEIDSDERMVGLVSFDLDDIDAAFVELDARYLAGEAAAHAHTWSVVSGAYAAMNRHELFPTTPDWTNVDHRRPGIIEEGGLNASLQSLWQLIPDVTFRIEAVHRLSNLGAVCTHVAHDVSLDGFGAEWRGIEVLTVEGSLINRCEIFEEADLDAALTRFEEVHPEPRLENAASQVEQRFNVCFSDRDWAAMEELLSDDVLVDDRRRVVNAGVLRGRDAEIASWRAVADLGVTNYKPAVIAVRGQRLTLSRYSISAGWSGTTVLSVSEINAQNQIVARVAFDPDDVDAAFEELDARYLAGEAARHSHTWSATVRGYAALNRGELPATTPEFVDIDHRRAAAVAPGELIDYFRAAIEQMPGFKIRIEAVHRLSDRGAVVTHSVHGTSRDGFDAEWREVSVVTFDGDLPNHIEVFDEADLDAALARFDELSPPSTVLENAATRTWARSVDAFNRRDVAGYLALLTADGRLEDRRKGLRALFDGPARVEAIRGFLQPPESWRLSTQPLAIRGSRLSLTRDCCRDTEAPDQPITIEVLTVMEIDNDNLIHDLVTFDSDDIDAALAELDARILTGEAAAHAQTWSVIAESFVSCNRRELPDTIPDPVYIDHRPLVSVDGVDLAASIQALWDITSEFYAYIATVHRLTGIGAVVTQVVKATAQEGSDAELWMICMFTLEGGLISRAEVFDEADLDAALARFDELDRPPLLENAATRTFARLVDAFNRRDMDACLEFVSAEGRYEHRRKGLRDVLDGPARQKAAYALFETLPSSWRLEADPIAIRGSRLSLIRLRFRDIDDPDRPITIELLRVIEVGDDDQIRHTVSFDPEDINEAFAELTARWIASREVAHPEIIKTMDLLIELTNRHEWEELIARIGDATYASHRQLTGAGADTIANYLSSAEVMASLVPDFWIEFVEVLTHSAMGVVAHTVLKGTSTDGVAVEIPLLQLVLLDDARVIHIETFEPAHRDLALARFDELNRSG